MNRFTRAAVCLAAAFVVCATAIAAGADDEGTDVVSALVAPGSRLDPTGAFYLIESDPGEAITQTVIVRNDRPHAVEAHVEAVDAFTRDETGAGYRAPGTAPVGTGTWVVVSTPVLTLQPGEEREIDFTVTVPEDAEPGQYLAGISASVPLQPTTESTIARETNAADVQITLQGVRIIAVQVNVPGPAAPELAVTGVRPVATPDGIALMIGLENSGNAFAKGEATVRVDSTDLRTGFDIDTFVSHTEIETRIPWTDDVRAGTHDVAVTLEFDDRQVAWNGTVEITAAMASQLQGELDDMRVPSAGGASLPIPLLVAGLIVTAGCIGGVIAVRRKRSSGSGGMRLTPSVR